MKKRSITDLSKLAIIFLLLAGVTYKMSCSVARLKPTFSQTSHPTAIKEITAIDSMKTPDTNQTGEINFPKASKEIKDFVVAPYQISMEAYGLLNDDDLEDAVLVLQNKTDSTQARPALVLLQQPDGSYKLNTKSLKAIGAAYINGDFKQYDSENIKIDSSTLTISTYNMGAVGNRITQYRFVNNQFVLTYMETYNMGAGGQTGTVYDMLNQKVTITDVNTTKEDMPATISSSKMKKHKSYLFENIDPTEIF